MTISVSPLPVEEKKEEQTSTSDKMDRLKFMYMFGKLVEKQDPNGMKLVKEMLLNPTKENADKVRRHFYGPTPKEFMEELEAKQKKRDKKYEFFNKICKCFYNIGYRTVRDYGHTGLVPPRGCRFEPECGRGDDLIFYSWKEAKDWLVRAGAWKENP